MVKAPVEKLYPSVKVIGHSGHFSFDLETIDETIRRPAVVFFHSELYRFQAIFDVNDRVFIGFSTTPVVLSRFSVNGMADGPSTVYCQSVMRAYMDMVKGPDQQKAKKCSSYNLKMNTGICSENKTTMVSKLVSDTEILKPLEACVYDCNGGKFSDLPNCLKGKCGILINEWDSCRGCIASESDTSICFPGCDNVKKLYACVDGECRVDPDGDPVGDHCNGLCDTQCVVKPLSFLLLAFLLLLAFFKFVCYRKK
jgi:hypothetical protein